jgi:hypothetical protein
LGSVQQFGSSAPAASAQRLLLDRESLIHPLFVCFIKHLIKHAVLKQSPTPFLQQLFFVPILFGTYFLYAVGFYLSPPIINGITIKLVIEMMNFKV